MWRPRCWPSSSPTPIRQAPLGCPQSALQPLRPGRRPVLDGGGEANAERHWEKHGGEFPEYGSEQAYVAGIHAFLLHPPEGTLVKHRDNGDTLYFDPASGVFAVQASDGAPRTFFKPNNGMAYWERQ